MSLVVHEDAAAELTAAADWYDVAQVGLGDELLVEAERVLDAIEAAPTTWRFVPGSSVVRRFPFTRFPYVAYFAIRDGQVLVLAFGHTSRKPGYWRDRLKR